MLSDLESEHTDLLQFLYACPVGLLQIAGDGTIGLINPLAMQLLLPIASVPWVTNFFDVIGAYAPELRNLADAFVGPNGPICRAHRIFVSAPSAREGGDDAKVLACTLVKLGAGRLMATIEDISKQVAQERRLKQAETWFASLIDGINDFAVLSLDAAGRIDGVNPSVTRQTGFAEADVLGKLLDIFDLPDPESSTLSTPEQMASARREGWHLDEGWRERRGGARYWCQRLIAVQSESDGDNGPVISGYTVILRDVTRQEFDSAKLRHMLTTDYLTGAYNRAHFFDVAERERMRCSRNRNPLALIALDVDHFKQVNDSYGHGVGDIVLKSLSAICKIVLRPSDTFARIGGEEFVVLLPSTDLVGAAQLAERLRAAIATMPIKAGKGFVRVTASLGCAVMATDATAVTELLAEADKALYEAKRLGRDRVVVSSCPRAVA
ncbi:sensor domain-containing diguanylate cyclase [Beijerinckia sp. L45]|uniref:sensor domain-containing diguanylate cyclase n=1 Tax=Beijerinckia sp. L45 TaxID=1641855 RepID=UPI00131EB7C7|nr:sensor domain-containing diguanylate cyclase [Beijerinckia sp. L45]